MSVSMFTDGWICVGSSIGSFTNGWICYDLEELDVVALPNPLLPLHISALERGMQVRISLRGGYHMTPLKTKRGNFLVLKNKPKSRRGSDKGILLGSLISNSPTEGKLSLHVQDILTKTTYQAEVLYKNMSVIHKVVPILSDEGDEVVKKYFLPTRVRLVRVKL